MTEAQARMDEDGRAALAVISANLRMAGNNPDRPWRVQPSKRNPVYGPSSYAVRGCDRKFDNVGTAATAQDLVCDAGGVAAPDSIAVTYEADRFNTVALPPGGAPTDCLGKPLDVINADLPVVVPPGPNATTQTVTFHVAENRFYIDSPGPDAAPSLYCKGNGASSTPGPLVENVEDLHLTFGTVPAAAPMDTANIAGYLNASGVVNHTALDPLDEAARWGRVAAVRVCVVVRSDRPVVGGEGSARFLKCDGSVENSPPDARLRRTYSTTVVLRNRR
ncbi:pilus assembly protein PilW [Ramlibacter henchirensis]|uniref:Pilus assembly protein PilW n=2 Tax=Ramlibacter henchirensis TaxID=204072 RepID=A0A4Z0C750_9BURK|nr:pilus assembly protein PilW [Ramlibacter henchirensis]